MGLAVEYEPEEYEPRPYKAPYSGKKVCTVDLETDPFAPGRIPKPFSCGFYDGETYVDFWGDDCVEQFFDYLSARTARGERFLIYAHNGGGFDFHFFLPWLDRGRMPLIIGGRLVQVWYAGQEFRDSYKILPAPLSAYKKDAIDYALFEANRREKHRAVILDYLRTDCIYLHEVITAFLKTFGEKLTIGQAAIDVLTSITGYSKISQHADKIYRNWFFGGRTQAFETGVVVPSAGERFHVYDVNSMYPFVMANYEHPLGEPQAVGTSIVKDTFFAKIELSMNDGALPRQLEDGSLDFTGGPGVYFVNIHELNAAEDLGLIKIKKVLSAVSIPHRGNFMEFVDRFYKLRLDAKAREDEAYTLIYKLLLNNAYGKFAQDSSRYDEYYLAGVTDDDVMPPNYEQDVFDNQNNPGGWRIHSRDVGGGIMWVRANRGAWKSYRNVRIAASITGAARSVLLRGLAAAKRPVYCDTDSIICEGLNADLDSKRLGAWKHEGTGDMLAVGGKKLYALFERGEVVNGQTPFKPLKTASKGVRLTAEQILKVARGGSIEHASEIPTFRVGKEVEFVARKIQRTDKDVIKFGVRKRVRW